MNIPTNEERASFDAPIDIPGSSKETTLGEVLQCDEARHELSTHYYGEEVVVASNGYGFIYDRADFTRALAHKIVAFHHSEIDVLEALGSLCQDFSRTPRGANALARYAEEFGDTLQVD